MISNGHKVSDIITESEGGRGSVFKLVTSVMTRFDNSWIGGSKVSSVTSLFSLPGVFLLIVEFSCRCDLLELLDDACVCCKRECISVSLCISVTVNVSVSQ
jgi:hypothetical protein